ncbi:max-binding protein MNT-like [Hippocampus zosterae]|uniref:max-binding protein MNT-like n=1 Tax=Hippocampus zosterae TaxID=109293 RepID=UPI00223D8997|nr:max-binding protein MNT-like [Hippocampus zosterae]
MSIDTLLEAARFLEWQAERDRSELAERQVQPRRLSREEDPCEATAPTGQKAESRRPEPLAPQPIGAGRGERPPCPAAPPPQAPVAVIPAMPVAAALPPARGSSPSPPRAPPRRPPSPPRVKADTANGPLQCGQSTCDSRPPVHLGYAAPASGDGAAPHPAPASHLGTNGLVPDDVRGGPNAKRRPGGAGTREVHNKLEQNRRAHLKECFETLKKNVPNVDDKKTSNLSVLRGALRYIQTLKRKEKEYEHEMERLAREKIAIQQRLAELKKELSQRMDAPEVERLIRQSVQPEDDQASTSTASEGEDDAERDGDKDAPAGARAPPPVPPPRPSSSPAPPPPRAPLPPAGVIARAAAPHPSVIQAVSRANHKQLPHVAPSPGPAPIGHITVHQVARLGALPALYPQGVSVARPAVVGHIARTFAPRQPGAGGGGGAPSQRAAAPGKAAAVLAPRPQLVGQAAVTMVTVPTFPIGTIKLA